MIIGIEGEFVDRKVLLNDLVRIINSFDNKNIEDLLNIRSNQSIEYVINYNNVE